jgi:hypothetical protein
MIMINEWINRRVKERIHREFISKLFKLFFLVFVSLWGFRRGLKIRVALVAIASIIIHLRYRTLR